MIRNSKHVAAAIAAMLTLTAACALAQQYPTKPIRFLVDRQLVAEDGNLLLPQTSGLRWNFSTEAVAKYGTVYPGSKEAWQVVRAEAR